MIETFRRFRESSWFKRLIEVRGLNVFYASLCVIDLFGVFPIVALPGALISCGYYGIPLLIFVLTLQIYTAVILGRCWIIAEKLDPNIIQKKRTPYAAVAQLIYGRRMHIFVTIMLNITVFGAGIPNILVASQNLQLIGSRISDGEFSMSFCYWLIILGIFLCPIMWLGSPKHMKAIASFSVVTVLTVSILIWICIMEDDSIASDSFSQIELDQPNIENMLKVYGMIAFQFDIHPMLMTIEVDMQNKAKIGSAVCYGLIVTCSLSIVTTILAAYQYGTETEANVLQMLPRSNILYGAILLVTVQLCLSHAVGSSALFQNIEEYLHVPKEFNIKRCILRSFIIALAVTIAELLPQFDIVMGIIGGTLTGPLIFILPPMFYHRLIRMEKVFDDNQQRESNTLMMAANDDNEDINLLNNARADKLHENPTKNGYGTFISQSTKFIRRQNVSLCYSGDAFICISVIIFGIIVTISSTYFNLMTASSFTDFMSPCIQNISFSFDEL